MASATKDKELYSGKASGLTFEAFDEKVITWCRKKYGDGYAVALWKNELSEIVNLDLDDDEDEGREKEADAPVENERFDGREGISESLLT